ncbi:phage portal protein [Micromonospora sp. NPDC049891]|uniref:phage portal protein n=1 Tax=Micromonospora sp. NPDC049891 TaxID=3155655 RepID=UPI0033E54B74
MLAAADLLSVVNEAYGIQERERVELDVLRRYATGKQPLPLVIPADAPPEVREMARIARINLVAIVLNSLTESLYLDGLRTTEVDESGDQQDVSLPVWDVWQANRLDRGQAGLYRATFTYGTAYMVVTAGRPVPVVRPVSPRAMTAVYGDDPDWPLFALERRRGGLWRLYDDTHVHTLKRDPDRGGWELAAEAAEHGLSYCPVIRYRDAEDLDEEDEAPPLVPDARGGRATQVVAGQVAPLMTLQDQADVTTFTLKSAEWYSAFRQRWIVGWTPENRTDKMRAGASQMWTFEENPEDVKLGEFSETTLDGYLRSREAVLKYAATLSQTPVHELIGELVNLSAEALAAAEAGRDRKVELRKTGLGESHEQTAQAIGDLLGVDVPDDIQVVWRDTSARAFGAIVDGLGKLAQMLGIPQQELWDRVPGVTQQTVRRWKAVAAQGDALGNLTALLERQAAGGGERVSAGGLILPPGVAA